MGFEAGRRVGSLVASGLKGSQCLKRFPRKCKTDLKNNGENPAETEVRDNCSVTAQERKLGRRAGDERPILSIGLEGSVQGCD